MTICIKKKTTIEEMLAQIVPWHLEDVRERHASAGDRYAVAEAQKVAAPVDMEKAQNSMATGERAIAEVGQLEEWLRKEKS